MLKKLLVYGIILAQSMSGVALGMVGEHPTEPAGTAEQAGKGTAQMPEWKNLTPEQQEQATQLYQQQLRQQAQQRQQTYFGNLSPADLTPQQQEAAQSLYIYQQTPPEDRPSLPTDVLNKIPQAQLQADFKNLDPQYLRILDSKIFTKLLPETQQKIFKYNPKEVTEMEQPEQKPAPIQPKVELTAEQQKLREELLKKQKQEQEQRLTTGRQRREAKTITRQRAQEFKKQSEQQQKVEAQDINRVIEKTKKQNDQLSAQAGRDAFEKKIQNYRNAIKNDTEILNATNINSQQTLMNNTTKLLKDYNNLFYESIPQFLGFEKLGRNGISDFSKNYDDLVNLAQAIRNIDSKIESSSIYKRAEELLRKQAAKTSTPEGIELSQLTPAERTELSNIRTFVDNLKTTDDIKRWFSEQESQLSLAETDGKITLYRVLAILQPERAFELSQNLISLLENKLKTTKDSEAKLKVQEELADSYKQLLLDVDKIETPQQLRQIMNRYSELTESITDNLERSLALAAQDLRGALWHRYGTRIAEEVAAEAFFGSPKEATKNVIKLIKTGAKYGNINDPRLLDNLRAVEYNAGIGNEGLFDNNELGMFNKSRHDISGFAPEITEEDIKSSLIPFGDIKSMQSDTSRLLLEEVVKNLQRLRADDPLRKTLQKKAENLSYEMIKARETAAQLYQQALTETYDTTTKKKLTNLRRQLSAGTEQLKVLYDPYYSKASAKPEADITREIQAEIDQITTDLKTAGLAVDPELIERYKTREARAKRFNVMKAYLQSIPLIISVITLITTIITIATETQQDKIDWHTF